MVIVFFSKLLKEIFILFKQQIIQHTAAQILTKKEAEIHKPCYKVTLLLLVNFKNVVIGFVK